MYYVSPIVEALRARPQPVFKTAALAQTLIWLLVPILFYSSPPGDLPEVLAIGHEWQLGSALGPPLAFWLAEIAFRLAGGSVIGVYILSQLCVLATLWAVFALARAIVGVRHAVLASLLMVGVSAFTISSVEFGPAVAGAPLAALALLHYWRAVGEGRRVFWLVLAIELGLLMLATYAGLVLLVLLALFTAVTARGRAALTSTHPWVALAIALLIFLPHLVWLFGSAAGSARAADASPLGPVYLLLNWLSLLVALVVAHGGLAVLVLVGGDLFADRRAEVPAIAREPVDPFARTFILCFALAPAVIGTLFAAFAGRATPIGGIGPLVVLSGILVVVLAGDVVHLRRQSITGFAWLALLLGPPAVTVAAIVLFPWTVGIELRINEPARAMGRFFTDSFNRRTNRPLAIVIGDARIGGLVALASRDRPSLFIDASPQRAPWIREADVREKGAIVVWPLTDAAGTPPAAIRARFPDLVPEVPRAFERPIQGRLPLMRIGWAMIRPSEPPPAAPAAAPPPPTK